MKDPWLPLPALFPGGETEEIAGALAARINCQKQLIAVKENGVSKPTFIIIILFEISVL